MKQNLTEKNQCLAMFIEFSKAFDMLSHTKLLDIPEKKKMNMRAQSKMV